MEFKSLKKIHDGHFIHRYDITYETVSYTHLTLPTIA